MKYSRRYASFIASLAMMMVQAAFADTPLNSNNWLGSAGAHYWNITTAGAYYVDIPETVFSTSNDYAIRVSASNVTIDGNGKTITGPGAPSTSGGPGTYGIRVNGGQPITNVNIKNLIVSNKFFGVIFESVNDGSIQLVTATGNRYGL